MGNNLQIRCDDMEMELAKMKSDKDAMLVALNEKTREFESKCDELEESENDKGRIKSQLSALSAEMDEQISNARRQTQRRLDQVTNEKKTLEETLAITTQSFNKSSKEVDKLKTQVLTLSAENDENKKRWDQLNEDRRKDARTIRRLKIIQHSQKLLIAKT